MGGCGRGERVRGVGGRGVRGGEGDCSGKHGVGGMTS